MRLSDGMLLGSVVLKPRRGLLITNDGNHGCALGMALVAAGETVKTIGPVVEDIVLMENLDTGKVEKINFGFQDYTLLRKYWPWILNTTANRPCTCFYRDKFNGYQEIITHLFDYHVMKIKDWTFDRLVDWVRSVEPVEEEEQSAMSLPTVDAGVLKERGY
jgi:hypothetical protein